MKILRNIILVFSIFCYSSLQAEIVKNIVIEGNKRVSTETIKIYGGIEINKDYSNKDLNNVLKDLYETDFFEDVKLEFSDDGIEMLAKISAEVNSSVENIGARRLHTIIEKVLDDISFNATDKAGETITIDKKFVQHNLGKLVKDTDLSKFIL